MVALSSLLTMNTVGLEILAVEEFSLATEVAASAQLRVIGRDFVPKLEALDMLPDLHDNTTCFVTGNDGPALRQRGLEVAVGDVQIGATDACRFNCLMVSSETSTERGPEDANP